MTPELFTARRLSAALIIYHSSVPSQPSMGQTYYSDPTHVSPPAPPPSRKTHRTIPFLPRPINTTRLINIPAVIIRILPRQHLLPPASNGSYRSSTLRANTADIVCPAGTVACNLLLSDAAVGRWWGKGKQCSLCSRKRTGDRRCLCRCRRSRWGSKVHPCALLECGLG